MSEPVSRPGLYILVFICLLNSCSADNAATKAAKELKRIADAVVGQQIPANLIDVR